MADDDITLHNYQDDLDIDPEATDPIINEETDDPAETFGVPEDEYRDELNKLDDEDDYEALEDLDEDQDDEQKY